MLKFRVIETDPAHYAPAVKRGWRWVQIHYNGTPLPWGTRWSGSLQDALYAIKRYDLLHTRPN